MNETSIYRNRNIFQKYLEVFFTKCRISLKEIIEYKTQFWSVLFFDVIIFFVMILFLNIYGTLVFEFLNWGTYDFFIFFCLLILAAKFIWMHFLRFFSTRLIQGELNLYLVRPVSSYFMMNCSTINGANIVTGFGFFMLTLILVYFGDYTNYFFSIIIFLFGICYYIIFHNFFASFSFFMKKGEFLVDLFNRRINFAIEEFTPKLFYKTPFQWVAFLMPSAIYGFFTLEALKGNFEIFSEFSLILLISFVIMFVGLLLQWHYGLKRYEAYG